MRNLSDQQSALQLFSFLSDCIYIFIMELVQKLNIILFALSLAFQGINLAAQGLAAKTYKDADVLGSTNTNVDSNQGYFAFVLAASSLSVLAYIYLLIVKIADKSPSILTDFVVWIVVLVLQFAVASVLTINTRNVSTVYDATMAILSAYEAAGATGPSIDIAKNYRTVHHLSMAALVIDYVFNFACGLILLALNTKNVLENLRTNPQRAKEQSTLAQIAQ